MDNLQVLAKELGYPGTQKLWTEARRRELDVSYKEVSEFTRAQAARQVLQARPVRPGRIVATEIMDRWAADLVDYNARPSPDPNGGPPYQYILLVQDIFSRKLWGHALKSKGSVEEARNYWRQALEHKPELATGYFGQ